jgi:hypothetical protein
MTKPTICNSKVKNIHLRSLFLLFTGKTLCYAVPIVHSLQKIQPKIEASTVNGLIIVHTKTY